MGITIMGQDIDSEVTIIGFQIGDIEGKEIINYNNLLPNFHILIRYIIP